MKKLLIIAIASSFLFISCAKVEPTPVSQTENLSKVTSAPRTTDIVILAHCFTVTNLEENPGVVEYRIEYKACDGTVKNVPLPEGKYLSDCIHYGTIKANFAYGILACR